MSSAQRERKLKAKKGLMATWDNSDSEEEDFDEEHANVALVMETCTTRSVSEDELLLDEESDSDDGREISLMTPLKHQSWYLDSGCSQHMTGERHMFQDLELKSGGVVGFGGDQKGKIIGYGTIGNDKLHSINNVLLVKGLMHNLITNQST